MVPPTDERKALARLATAQALANEVLAEYLRRAAAYHRDPDLRRLRAELHEAKREGRVAGRVRADAPRSVPEAVTPRVFSFTSAAERDAAWRELRERHGLIGAVPVKSMTPTGRERKEATSTFVKPLTARQKSLGTGIDAMTIHHDIHASQRDRVLAWLGIIRRDGGPTGRPRFASRRDPIDAMMSATAIRRNMRSLAALRHTGGGSSCGFRQR